MSTSSKMALRRFTLRAAAGYRGRDGNEKFVRELLAAFGSAWPSADHEAADGAAFNHSFAVVDDGRRGKRALSLYWSSRRVVVEVVEREAMLDVAWQELLRACLQMIAEPQYVILTNQRDVHLYDLSRDRSEPRLSVPLDELPKYSEAFPFFRSDWVPGTTPRIINVDKVSKEVAELVAKVHTALRRKNAGRERDVIRFTLQCIVAMFAEDIGLLPKEYFTTLLYQGAEDEDVEKRLGKLFSAMSTKRSKDSDIPYFNGGLFTDPVSLTVGSEPLRALTKAAEANWTFVDPHIFGSVFQGIMTAEERHASGAHYTAREDIMSVVGPTVIEPWRARIDEATTLTDLSSVLKDLSSYRVLDPACGSGNFLYVAFRELYRLETEVLCRMFEFASVQKGRNKAGWVSGIRTTNFFGIDINAFAVELAKTTLNIAKKIAFEERKATVLELYEQAFLEMDPSLPLDNLDANIVCSDALFTEWPAADAIIGNPPFLGGLKIREELGQDYVRKLRTAYPEVNGRADLCSYWFRRAHDRLSPDGRAGLVATNTIREGHTRRAATEYVVEHGGTITNAVSSRTWPGEAAVTVSMVNWVRGDFAAPRTLFVDSQIYRTQNISPHLQLHADLRSASSLTANADGTTTGIQLGTKSFQVNLAKAKELAEDPAARPFVRPLAAASHLMMGRITTNPDYVVDLSSLDSEEAAKTSGSAYAYLREHVYPFVSKKAASATVAHYQNWLRTWWRPIWPRSDFFAKLPSHQRLIVCSRHAARPVFVFLHPRLFPTESLQVFGVADDYSFGILQSNLHWSWAKGIGSKIEERIRYTKDVWTSFPWPQEPGDQEVANVAQAGRALRETRRELMSENGWSLRDLHQSAEVAGPHPLKSAQNALDSAVEQAYGKPAGQEATEFLLELNGLLAEDEAEGAAIQGPGLPAELDPSDERWCSNDCVEPPHGGFVAADAGN